MANPSGTYDFIAKYIGQKTWQLSIEVDTATGGLSGTLGTRPGDPGTDLSNVAGTWDDATSHITFNDAPAGEILFTHFFDGYISQQVEVDGAVIEIASLAGTYHDFRIDVAGGVVTFNQDSGGWYATPQSVGP